MLSSTGETGGGGSEGGRIEQIRAEARSIDRLEELFRDDDVGVDVGTVERSHQSSQDAKGLHQ